MMDLYEAIDVLQEYITYCVVDGYQGDPRAMPTNEELEAMKICLEAARDKAGV